MCTWELQVMGAQWYDGNISLPGCDKNMPGTIIAMARLNRPAIMIYGGTIKPGMGSTSDEPLDIVSAFQSYGKRLLHHPLYHSSFGFPIHLVHKSFADAVARASLLRNAVMIGAFSAGIMDEEQRFDVVRNSCPGAGACGGMYTANTMASAIEVMHSHSGPAVAPYALPCFMVHWRRWLAGVRLGMIRIQWQHAELADTPCCCHGRQWA